jgi:glycosyltransferase involved in cell wall biosynthesis
MELYKRKKTLFHIGRGPDAIVQEGGFSRDAAIYEFLKGRSVFIDARDVIVKRMIKIFALLMSSKDNLIVIHYPLLGVPVSNRLFVTAIIRSLFLSALSFASKRNKLIVDVSDLPVEQAIDLELPILSCYKRVESVLFSLNCNFIFASFSMRDYICEKYGLNKLHTKVCINGGPKLIQAHLDKYQHFIEREKINYVYAGTLNKGRQIEKMIDIFSSHPNANLILMGLNGEWIDEKFGNIQNIKYVGAQPEAIAHGIVSMCDIGLIPYDSQRFYYQLAYPTKLSFYITAGIPFLSTDVMEVRNVNTMHNFGILADIDQWPAVINALTKDQLSELKVNAAQAQDNFQWPNILANVFADSK